MANKSQTVLDHKPVVDLIFVILIKNYKKYKINVKID